MTRKHFNALAAIFRQHRDMFDGGRNPNKVAANEELARRMADYLDTQNPNFDRARFLEACGVRP
jgi:hypothetical protein